MIDWEKVKREVDFEHYFMFKMAHIFTFDKLKRAYVRKNEDGSSGDIIRFFNHRESGNKMYHSYINNDNGDIIQFIKRRILGNDASPAEINEELSTYLGSVDQFRYTPETLSRKLHPKAPEQFQIRGNIIPLQSSHYDYLINNRKFSPNTLAAEPFSDLFFTYQTSNSCSLSFFVTDLKQEIIGLNRIQTEPGQYFNKKWFEKGTDNANGFTLCRTNGKAETLSIFESVFDALSFYELFPAQNMQFLSSNGELGFRKAGIIVTWYRQMGFKKIFLCNDNDMAGQVFNLNIIGNIIPIFKNISKDQQLIKFELIPHPELNSKIKVLMQFFKFVHSAPEEYKTPYYLENVASDGSIFYTLAFLKTVENVEFFLSLLIRIFDLGDFIQVIRPILKDFNEDLIQKKKMNAEKFF